MWHREPRAFSHILFTPDSRSLLLAGEGFRHTRAIRRLDAEGGRSVGLDLNGHELAFWGEGRGTCVVWVPAEGPEEAQVARWPSLTISRLKASSISAAD